MVAPTKPGFYWLKEDGEWTIAQVVGHCSLFVMLLGTEVPYDISDFPPDSWGNEITR